MSLTSYRAAPPRDGCSRRWWEPVGSRGVLRNRGVDIVFERLLSLIRFGGDLLSHVLRRSTIGVVALIGRVRDGIGSFAAAMTTKPGKRHGRACALSAPDGSGDAKASCSANISVVSKSRLRGMRAAYVLLLTIQGKSEGRGRGHLVPLAFEHHLCGRCS